MSAAAVTVTPTLPASAEATIGQTPHSQLSDGILSDTGAPAWGAWPAAAINGTPSVPPFPENDSSAD
jgi:hypothetical protein